MSHRNILVDRIIADAVGPKPLTAVDIEISVNGSLSAPCRLAMEDTKGGALKFKVPIKERAQIKIALFLATDELASTSVVISNPGMISCRLIANSVAYSIQFEVDFGSPFDLSFASVILGMRFELMFEYTTRHMSEKFWVYYALYFVFLWSVYWGNLSHRTQHGHLPPSNQHSIVISVGNILSQNEFVSGCILLSNEPCSPAALLLQGMFWCFLQSFLFSLLHVQTTAT